MDGSPELRVWDDRNPGGLVRYRELGKSGIVVSEIGLGCWALGGPSWDKGEATGWSDVCESDIREAVDYALEAGVNHFDNADCYGNGKAERMLGKILGERSKDVVIASKVGFLKGSAEHAYEPFHIQAQCEQSLINLKREYIDIYYFHNADFGDNDRYLDDAVYVMQKLKRQGKIRVIGLSSYTTKDFVRLIPKIKPDVIQSFANIKDDRFIADKTLVRQMLEEYGIPFIAFSPLDQGLLLNKYNASNLPKFGPGDHRQNLKKFSKEAIEELGIKLDKLGVRFGREIEDYARVALQYILNFDVVGGVIPGFRNKKQVELNLKAADKPLNEEDMEYIKKIFN